ncbi:MAG: general secretion pathway protein GspB [Desulfuromonadales bacterium]|nr:general secretion pathway protein GspB [Desulfuromonadales bacterium]
MSSILKALKKLEEEQAGRPASSSAGHGGQFVTSMRGGRPLLLLIVGIGAGLLLAGGLYFWVGGPREIQRPSPPAAQEQKPAGISDAAAPGAHPVAAEPPPVRSMTAAVPPVAPVAVPPVKVVVAAAPRVTEKVVSVAPEETNKSDMVPTEPALPARAAEEPRQMPVEQVQIERREIPAPGQQWSATHLTVSDILPAAGGGRMAIVNGLPVMEGTMVEDAVVREIHPTQVIFEVGGKSVVVPLAPSR